MHGRMRSLGLVLAVMGIGFIAAGSFAFLKTYEGYNSLNALSAAQDVRLSYNDQGQLTDHGDAASAQSILGLLRDEWKYPVNMGDLNPNDPVVNTATEFMFQMATITHHITSGTQTVVLPADVTAADGTVYKAGTYEFAVDGRYFSQFNRANPIEGKARDQAWSATGLALISNLGVGTATATALQLGLGIAGLFAGFGLFALVAGFGLVWVARAATEEERAPKVVLQPRAMPA
ncbi:MAG TPA: hypothetical protein VJ850_03580 [Candidatus Limnocylindrales bacterium]|nr:hypothetical protein [Candidatus Limnocylindrales bacterium]